MPSKIRVKHGRSVKRKKWPKGHSSESNPTTRKFRNEAKKGLSLPEGNKVKSSIADYQMTDEPDDREEDMLTGLENLSLSGITNLSSFSKCTNASFTSLGNLWGSRMESHQDICAVLAAVTDVIKSNGGSESDTDYFAALSSALESADDDITTATSVAFLLSIIIVKVPDSVLQTQYSHLTKLISARMNECEGNDSGTSLQRSLLSCLSTLLSKQPLATWQETFTQNMFCRILQQTISSKPKVRRVAHQGLSIITRSAATGGEPIVAHPIWKISTQFFQDVFQKHSRKDQIKNVFHVLNLLKFILHLFPSQQNRILCECILKCSTSKSHHLHSLSLRILQTFFMQSPHISCLASQLNSHIVHALSQTHPKPHETDFIEPWLGAVQSGLTHLSTVRATETHSLCSALFGICFEYLRLCHSAVIFNCIVNTLQIVTEKCLIEHRELLKRPLSDSSSFLVSILDAIRGVLLARNSDSLPHILKIQTAFFRVFDRESGQLIRENVQFLTNTVKNWPEMAMHSSHLDLALAAAVEIIGVRSFIECVPLQLNVEEADLTNSWVLPFLKNCIMNEDITFFKEFFILMATELRQNATERAQVGDEINAKIYETLEGQVWDLLPRLFKTAVNVEQGFPLVARLLGTLLQERVDLRNNIATALRQLIEHHIENKQAIECVNKYSKNYLPILFNLYIETESKHHNRAIIIGCLSSFMKISSSEIIESYFNKIGSMLNSDQTDAATKPALLDLGATMLPYINSSQLGLTLKQAGHYLTADNHSLQKKGYLALERMLNLSDDNQVKFLKNNLKSIKWLIVNSASKMNPTSKKHRLKCIFSVLHLIECSDMKFITSTLPEVILSIKEINGEVRSVSYNILLLICKCALEKEEQNKHALLEELVTKISAGLAGSEHMQSCTVLCLAKLVHEFRFSLSDEFVGKLLEAIYTFSESNSKQIIRYCLYFVNVVVSVMSIGFVMGHIKTLVKQMFKWNKNANSHFLMKVKVIIEKMLRKVGSENLSEVFPNSHKNLLRSVRKSADKRKRLKDSKRERQAEESIDDSNSNTMTSRGLVPAGFDELMLSDEEKAEDKRSRTTKSERSKAKQSKSKMWIQEEGAGDPIDFLDPQSSDRILTTNPKKKDKKVKDSNLDEILSFNEEGKLIVTNERGRHTELDSASETESIQTEKQSTITASARSISSKRSVKKSKLYKPIADGRVYKSKKAGGDMKRKNKPDPYAYLPLNKGQLRIKRKQKKLQGTLKSILTKASKGSVHGRKVRHFRNSKAA